MADIFDQIAEEDIFDQVARETPAPKLPVIAGTEGMELFSDNASKINQK